MLSRCNPVALILISTPVCEKKEFSIDECPLSVSFSKGAYHRGLAIQPLNGWLITPYTNCCVAGGASLIHSP
jgi:hypothetical protein